MLKVSIVKNKVIKYFFITFLLHWAIKGGFQNSHWAFQGGFHSQFVIQGGYQNSNWAIPM